MKAVLLLFVITLISLTVRATSQFGDILIWNGDTCQLFSNPLEFNTNWDKLSDIVLKGR